jgi:hypothetical protein
MTKKSKTQKRAVTRCPFCRDPLASIFFDSYERCATCFEIVTDVTNQRRGPNEMRSQHDNDRLLALGAQPRWIAEAGPTGGFVCELRDVTSGQIIAEATASDKRTAMLRAIDAAETARGATQ